MEEDKSIHVFKILKCLLAFSITGKCISMHFPGCLSDKKKKIDILRSLKFIPQTIPKSYITIVSANLGWNIKKKRKKKKKKRKARFLKFSQDNWPLRLIQESLHATQ